MLADMGADVVKVEAPKGATRGATAIRRRGRARVLMALTGTSEE